jgi:hypothetical protein
VFGVFTECLSNQLIIKTVKNNRRQNNKTGAFLEARSFFTLLIAAKEIWHSYLEIT